MGELELDLLVRKKLAVEVCLGAYFNTHKWLGCLGTGICGQRLFQQFHLDTLKSLQCGVQARDRSITLV